MPTTWNPMHLLVLWTTLQRGRDRTRRARKVPLRKGGWFASRAVEEFGTHPTPRSSATDMRRRRQGANQRFGRKNIGLLLHEWHAQSAQMFPPWNLPLRIGLP